MYVNEKCKNDSRNWGLIEKDGDGEFNYDIL
jgi:hypothetical protein